MMTEQDIAEIEQGYTEAKIQHTCVSWYRAMFEEEAGLLFAVPNGGWRGARAGAQMVYEGQMRGVADLIFLCPCEGKAALCIEMKTPRRKGSSAGSQSVHQKEWQALIESHGSRYVVCHGLIEFVRAMCAHLGIAPNNFIDDVLQHYPLYLR